MTVSNFDLGTFLLQALWAFLATCGFAVLFNVPRKTLLSCGLVGAGGHVLRYTLRGIGVSNEVATFFAALLVGLVGYRVAVLYTLPRLVFTVTGIISMVPGIQAYEVLVYFHLGNIQEGLNFAVRAALVTGAIAAGLGTARILTDMDWQRSGESHS